MSRLQHTFVVRREAASAQANLPLLPPDRPVLIVQAAAHLAETVTGSLQRDGWRTELATTLAEAARKLANHNPLLLLVERRLPDGDGFELIRQAGPRGDLGLIAIGDRLDEVDRIVALELGADAVVSTPFSPRELAAQVRALARRIRPCRDDHPRSARWPRGAASGARRVRLDAGWPPRPWTLGALGC